MQSADLLGRRIKSSLFGNLYTEFVNCTKSGHPTWVWVEELYCLED